MTVISEAFCDSGVPGDLTDGLATQLAVSPQAIEEAIRRELLTFVTHRNVACWRFGDTHNGCFRRLDGQPFVINGQRVKAEAETKGKSWHRLIGLDDVLTNQPSDILLTPEGSKDALAALHFAAAEDRLASIGIAVALGASVNLRPDDLEILRGRRIRIAGDADQGGQEAVSRFANQLSTVAAEVQLLDLHALHRDDGSLVNDLFDVTRIDYDDFEANRDLWSITDLDSKGERIKLINRDSELFLSLSSPPHGFPVSPEFPVYPVSNRQELEKRLVELADGNACILAGTARKNRFKLLRDLAALEKEIGRKLNAEELMQSFDRWYCASLPHLDPNKSRDDYCTSFFAELNRVRVPTGEGEALKQALARVSILSPAELPDLPRIANPPESWRALAALHRELARHSANGTYFLSCREAAKAHPSLNKDSAYNADLALERLDVVKIVRVGDARPVGGKATEFRYLLPLSSGTQNRS